MRVGEQAYAGKVQFSVAGKCLAPASRHIGDGFGCAGQRAAQGVLGSAVDDAL